MKPTPTAPTSDLEDEVLKSAARDFMGTVDASAHIIDVTPEDRPASSKKPASPKKKTLSLVIGILLVGGIGAAAFLSSRSADPVPTSPLLAEIDAASRTAPPADSAGPADGASEASPLGDAPALSPIASLDPAPASDAPLPPVSAHAPAALPDSAPPIVIRPDSADLAEAPAATTGTAAPGVPSAAAEAAPPAPVAPPAPAPAAAASDALPAATAAELHNLRAKVRTLERVALTPTTIEVAEVLADGVVLRDAQGRTVVVPNGGKVKASGGRVEQR